MASKPVTINVKSRGKPIRGLPKTVNTYLQGSTSDLYNRLAAEAKTSQHRLRITDANNVLIPNAKDHSIERTGLKSDSTINVKDLGQQIAWQTVFIIEYFGPLVIHPLVYFLRPYLFANAPPPSTAQTLSCALISLHFLKREFETLFVHRFSNATMPLSNIFKNSGHYWVFAGANIAFWTYKTGAPAETLSNPLIIAVALALFVVGELGNLSTHLTLRGLRSTGGTERGIPKGASFDLVTCPNYMFETIAWAGIWLITYSLSTGLFVAFAVFQMALWSKKKESRYRKEFGDKYKKKRFGIIPGVY